MFGKLKLTIDKSHVILTDIGLNVFYLHSIHKVQKRIGLSKNAIHALSWTDIAYESTRIWLKVVLGVQTQLWEKFDT